jgi:predicted Zn-dependent protease
MTKDRSIYLTLRKLNSQIQELSTQEAVQRIDSLIEEKNDDKFTAPLLVEKASVLWSASRQNEALAILTDCCNRFSADPSASFHLGEHLVELAQYERAKGYLSQCIESSLQTDDAWYLDSAYLLHAYAAAKTGDRKSAAQSLVHITDDEPMDWIATDPPVSKDSIKAMLG